jgi:nucleotide-binding universal stress UspA family protein
MIELNRILCPIDFSAFSDHALTYAVRMAKWYTAALRVLHVMPPLPPSTVSELAATSRMLTARNLQIAVDSHRLPGVDIATELVESPDPAGKILESANRYGPDLIVMGSHGRSGLQRVLLGSVVETLLHKSLRPLLTIPSHIDPKRLADRAPMRRIICAVDFAEASISALAFAMSLAEEANAQLTLLHVIELPPELQHPPEPPDYDIMPIRAAAEAESRQRLTELVPEHARDYCTVETTVLEGGPSRQILRLAAVQDADLIVLGVHGRSAFDLAFFGSNSKDIIRQSRCPVLVVPGSSRAALKTAS